MGGGGTFANGRLKEFKIGIQNCSGLSTSAFEPERSRDYLILVTLTGIYLDIIWESSFFDVPMKTIYFEKHVLQIVNLFCF